MGPKMGKPLVPGMGLRGRGMCGCSGEEDEVIIKKEFMKNGEDREGNV